MNTGTIKFFDETKGFGFIREDHTNQEIFIHATGLKEKVAQNDKVSFEIVEGKKRQNAVNVQKV
ncbi:cold shock domain-containing protein [Cytophagaceae bacterium ABcell3]|nr:cold shock domain-containing protein [Cytophagaceae bacterium ABcell3]